MVSRDKVGMVTKQNRATLFRVVSKKEILLLSESAAEAVKF
jgi:hypothetical protein